MTRDHLTVFLDTNSLLHYPPIKQVEWRSVCDSNNVTLVICIQVIHELDEKKGDSRLSERAERAIREIRTISTCGGGVRDGVTIEVFTHEPRDADFSGTLSPDSKDDRIVHLVKEYVEQTGDDAIAVYTEDYGMLLRCEAHGIMIVEPDRDTRQETPKSDLERKYKTAVTELEQLRNRLPEISVTILSDPDQGARGPVRIALQRSIALLDPDKEMQHQRATLQIHATPAPDALAGPFKGLRSDPFKSLGIPQSEYDRYERELERYLDEYRVYISETNTFQEQCARLLCFHVYIGNSGRSPAEAVEAVLSFPPCLQALGCGNKVIGEMAREPREPAPPQEPKPAIAASIGAVNLSPFPHADFLNRVPRLADITRSRFDSFFEITGDVDDGFSVHLHIPKLRHGKGALFADFFGVLRTWEEAKPFQVRWTLAADNLPERKEGTLAFLVEVAE